jgi:MATE family, multidrug efflux pump
MSRAVWSVSLPILFAQTSETIVHVTNTIFLASVGVGALGAIALADTIYELVMVPAVGLAAGIQILVARRAGQRRKEAIGETFNLGLGLLLSVSLALMLALRLGAPYLSALVVQSAEVRAAVVPFLRVIAFGMLFHAANLAYAALFIGLSRTGVLIPATLLLAGTNIVLDYSLIFGHFGLPRLGIAGAGWGSVGAEVVTFLYLTLHTLRRLGIDEYGLFRWPRFHGRLIRVLGTISAPVALQALVEGVRWFLFFVIVEHLGAEMLAISNVVYGCYALLRVPTEGFAETACSMVSGLIGRSQASRIGMLVRRVITPCYLITLPFAALAFLFPESLVSSFTGNQAVIAGCAGGVRVVAAAMPVIIPAQMWFSAVSGTGDTGVAFLIEFALTVAMVLVAYLAGFTLRLSLGYVWASLPVSWLLCLSLSYGWIRTGHWRRLAI